MQKDVDITKIRYKKEQVIFTVYADIWFRIPQHKRKLVSELKKEIKSLSIANGNAKVRGVVRDRNVMLLYF